MLIVKPLDIKNTDNQKMKDVLYVISLMTIKTSILLSPVIPSSIDKALNIYNLSINNLNLIILKIFHLTLLI